MENQWAEWMENLDGSKVGFLDGALVGETVGACEGLFVGVRCRCL